MESPHNAFQIDMNKLAENQPTETEAFRPETIVVGYLQKWQDAANDLCEETKLEPHVQNLIKFTTAAATRSASRPEHQVAHALDAANDATYAQDDITSDPVYKLKHAA